MTEGKEQKVSLMEVVGVRTDLDDFFQISGVLDTEKHPHHPFIVIDEENGKVTVESSTCGLISNYDPACRVLCQWRGRWKSDFFLFTVAEVVKRLKE